MNEEALKELKDAGQGLRPQQHVQWLLLRVKNHDIQVQTMLGIILDHYLTDFDAACLTLSRTVSTRFTNVETNRFNCSIGAVSANSGCGGLGRRRCKHRKGCHSSKCWRSPLHRGERGLMSLISLATSLHHMNRVRWSSSLLLDIVLTPLTSNVNS